MNENETKRKRLCAITIAFGATASGGRVQAREKCQKNFRYYPEDDVMEYFHRPKKNWSGGSGGKEWKISENVERAKFM